MHDYVMDKIRDNGLDAEIIYVAVTGTRSRGIENKNSDIDVAVEYKAASGRMTSLICFMKTA